MISPSSRSCFKLRDHSQSLRVSGKELSAFGPSSVKERGSDFTLSLTRQSLHTYPHGAQQGKTSSNVKKEAATLPSSPPSFLPSLAKKPDLVPLSWRSCGSSPQLLLHVGYAFLFTLVSSQTPPPSSSSLFHSPSLSSVLPPSCGRRVVATGGVQSGMQQQQQQRLWFAFYPLVFLLAATSASTARIFLWPQI